MDFYICMCDHAIDEHRADRGFPCSTSCTVEGCDCVCFDRNREVGTTPSQTHAVQPKFDNVYCSNCGRDFGPGDHGFSHCENHKGLVGEVMNEYHDNECEGHWNCLCGWRKSQADEHAALVAELAEFKAKGAETIIAAGRKLVESMARVQVLEALLWSRPAVDDGTLRLTEWYRRIDSALPSPSETHPEYKGGPNFRHLPGGGIACGWCGFALVVEGPRQCCPEGIAYDAGSTYSTSEPDGAQS